MSRNSCKCPRCGQLEAKAQVTRVTEDGEIIRFRKCGACGEARFTLQWPEEEIDRGRVEWCDYGKAVKIIPMREYAAAARRTQQ